MNPSVSVIISTYNRAALVANAIESVFQQTFSDYELIVVDDGSTDDTRERLERYSARIQYVYRANGGMSAALNTGVKLARGEWIAFLDSDDLWHPTKLERQIEALDSLGSEFGACITDCRYVGAPGLTMTVFESGGLETEAEFGPLNNVMKHLFWERPYPIFIQSLCVQRSVLAEAGGLDDSVVVQVDRDLMFRLSFRTRFCYVSSPLVDINRSTDLPRLTDVFSKRNDDRFVQDETLCEKMLSHPEFVDPQAREAVRDELIRVYYSWAAARLGELRIATARRIVSKLRRLGQKRWTIFRVLMSRTGKKLSRTVHAAPAEQRESSL